MIYLVTNQLSMFKSDKYQIISVKEALNMLEPLKECELDTETMGF
jgi:hypothetical protein